MASSTPPPSIFSLMYNSTSLFFSIPNRIQFLLDKQKMLKSFCSSLRAKIIWKTDKTNEVKGSGYRIEGERQGRDGKEGKGGPCRWAALQFCSFCATAKWNCSTSVNKKKPIANNMAAKLLTVQGQGRSEAWEGVVSGIGIYDVILLAAEIN